MKFFIVTLCTLYVVVCKILFVMQFHTQIEPDRTDYHVFRSHFCIIAQHLDQVSLTCSECSLLVGNMGAK